MTTYVTNDGAEFEAANAREVLAYLRQDAWVKSDATDAEFMRDMASRVNEQTGANIATDDVDEFVAGLVRVGLLKEKANV